MVDVASVKHLNSSDDCVRIKSEGENLKECGKTYGNHHTTYTLTVEVTLVPTRDNRNNRPRISEEMIHTDVKVVNQMEVSVDNTKYASPRN